MFINIIENTKSTFIGYLNEEIFIDILYVGWHSKGIKSYKIQIWKDECGCIYEEIKRFSNIDDAILYAVEKSTQ